MKGKTLIINEKLWICTGGLAGFFLLEGVSLLSNLTLLDAFLRGCTGLLAGGYLARFLLRSIEKQVKTAAKIQPTHQPPDAK